MTDSQANWLSRLWGAYRATERFVDSYPSEVDDEWRAAAESLSLDFSESSLKPRIGGDVGQCDVLAGWNPHTSGGLGPSPPENWFVRVRYPTDTFGFSLQHEGTSQRRRVDVGNDRLEAVCNVKWEKVEGDEPPIETIVAFFSDSKRTESLIRLFTDYPYADVAHIRKGIGRIRLGWEGRGTATEIHKVITDLLETGESLADPPRP